MAIRTLRLGEQKPGPTHPKDQADFDTTESLLDQTQRTWLGSALALAHPGHPWLERLR